MKFLNKYILILIAALFCINSSFINAQIAIIANKSVNITSIDITNLKNLYTIQSNEAGSQKVKLFFLNENGDTENKFLGAMGKSLLELKKVWLTAKLTGNGKPPDMVATAKDMIEKIKSTPGAIGFVDLKSVNESIKVLLKID
jgi:ABC-type phosphate transport system substrate-binding protein